MNGADTIRDVGPQTRRQRRAYTAVAESPLKGARADDPAWELYFEERLSAQMASTLTGRATVRHLWLQQDGKCLVCGQPLTLADGWHIHHLQQRVYGGDHAPYNLVLLHPNCHRQVHCKRLVVEKAASREGRS